MFYLIEFAKILKNNFVTGAVFLLSMWGVLALNHFHVEIDNALSLKGKIDNSPYFNALVRKNVDISMIQRRLGKLPGVVSVEQDQSKRLKQELGKLKQSFGDQIIQGLSAINYQKFKVEVEKGLKQKSYQLIQEYLTRLVGVESITIGKIKSPNSVKLKKDDTLFKLLEWGDSYASILFSLLWLFSFGLLIKSMQKRTFIIEKFQRKSHVLLKMSLAGTGVILVMGLGLNMLFKGAVVPRELMAITVFVLLTMVLPLFVQKVQANRYV